jgi:hypothetical protein
LSSLPSYQQPLDLPTPPAGVRVRWSRWQDGAYRDCTQAERIQRRRTPGWRMPASALYVGRPTKWGNCYRRGYSCCYYGALAPGAFGAYSPAAIDDHCASTRSPRFWDQCPDAETAVLWYREMITAHPYIVAAVRAELCGRDLACWCPLDQPCHADVLLEIANGLS